MKILIVSAAPHLNTKLGKINSDIIKYFISRGDRVASVVWDLDPSWNFPNSEGRYFYEKNGQQICQIYPIQKNAEQAAVELYEINKALQPDVILSIGDIDETEFIYSIKILNPDKIKWVSVLSISALPIDEGKKEVFEQMDSIICLNKFSKKEIEKLGVTVDLLEYGPNHEIFYDKNARKDNEFNIVCISKNSTASNLPSLIKAIELASKKEKIKTYLYTNIHDIGDYKIDNLKNKYDFTNIVLPEKYNGINDGLSDVELSDLFNDSDAIIDISVRSSTGISVLEGMACGCIPIVVNTDRMKELLLSISDKHNYFCKSIEYVSFNEEILKIADFEDLSRKIVELCELKRRNKLFFDICKDMCINRARDFSNKIFLKSLEEAIKKIGSNRSNVLIVEKN